MIPTHRRFPHAAIIIVVTLVTLLSTSDTSYGHGTVVDPISRVYRVFQSNPESPDFPLAAAAVAIDGTLSYYTWNELSRNISAAVGAGLPPAFDYSPWVPDGQLASGGRVDPASPEYPRTYAGLDQVSPDWPTTAMNAGETYKIDFYATASHDPSVWDVWMTTPDWDPATALTWDWMEHLGRPDVTHVGDHYYFDLTIPRDRSGHHVLWVAWQRDDPVGEVFFSTSDIDVAAVECAGDVDGDGSVALTDLLLVLANWGTDGAGADLADPPDVVDLLDLITVLASWGDC